MAAVGQLARPGFAAQLAHGLSLRIPALHVGFRDHAAAGVDRKFAARSDSHRLDKMGRLALFAISVILQDIEKLAGEIIVVIKRVDIRRSDSRHVVALPARLPHLYAAEIQLRTQLINCSVLLAPAYAFDRDQRVARHLPGALDAGYDQSGTAIVDQAVI